MRRKFAFTLYAILTATLAAGQQGAAPTSTTPTVAPRSAQTVYYAGTRVTRPALLPVTLTDAATEPCKHLDGIAEVRTVVDATGAPHGVTDLGAAKNVLDQEALKLVASERFKPGTYHGAAVDVGITTWLELKACIEERIDENGQEIELIRLRSVPNQGLWLSPSPNESAGPGLKTAPSGVGKDVPDNPYARVSPPVALSTPGPDMSDLVRDHNFTGVCVITLWVDTDGHPENIRLWKSVRPDLDQRAIEAVSKYRFKPARTADGSPIPVMISVNINFRLPY
jgi:TonB family protein